VNCTCLFLVQVLKNLSFQVEAGQRVAIVGPSGSGKSTILKLLARLYRPSNGVIKVAGQAINDLKQSSLRKHLAVVPQDTVLFNDSILENIRYGRLEASDEEVKAAAALAHLDQAIARMPDGYGTAVGERGLKLSGGEKQRVAIARAFLRDPELLICDEATSALDTATEQGIMESLNELAEGRTGVFVAHRLSTVMGCDKIIVMAEGAVVEEGTHADLMACGGVYRDMWDMQVCDECNLLSYRPRLEFTVLARVLWT
jgi:ATP-binding cassette, subfamily B, heavy metal transporter